MKGKGLTVLEETPELLRAKNATQILNEVGPQGGWRVVALFQMISRPSLFLSSLAAY